MPTYEYQCQGCDERLEVFQKFSDKPLKSHPDCGGALQKVFHASGVVFKGSGYYITESRSGSKSSKSDSAPSSDKATSDKTPAKPKTERKPESGQSKPSPAAAAG